MKPEEIEEIRKRAEAPTSMGFSFTHYKKDVMALLAHIEMLEDRLDAAGEHIRGEDN